MVSNTPEYHVWEGMMARCNNPSAAFYKYYGARDIKVCERWRIFRSFLEDMGKRPSPKHSLDRIDNKKDYTPSNCRWATALQQSLNRGINKNNSSGYKGVTFKRGLSKYIAQIQENGRGYHLGVYEIAEQAAIAYDQAAMQLWGGEIQNLNFL